MRQGHATELIFAAVIAAPLGLTGIEIHARTGRNLTARQRRAALARLERLGLVTPLTELPFLGHGKRVVRWLPPRPGKVFAPSSKTRGRGSFTPGVRKPARPALLPAAGLPGLPSGESRC
jgi:hypothetical protein